jgi:hypothetical protein
LRIPISSVGVKINRAKKTLAPLLVDIHWYIVVIPLSYVGEG